MGNARQKFLKRTAALALMAGIATMAGCALFPNNIGILPSSRFVVTPNPSMVKVVHTYKIKDNTITAEAEEVKFKVQSFAGDGTPGMRLTGCTAEYMDMTSREIPSTLLAKMDFGIAAYAPPATPGKPSEIELDLPVYNQQVRLYGDEQAFTFFATPGLNRHFSHVIMCRVTLRGEDDNLNPVSLSMDVPIRFEASIVQ